VAAPGGAHSNHEAGAVLPKVSVIIACYNQAGYVADAIRSVLAQTFSDLELIVVDDGSADGTPAVIASFRDPRIRSVRQKNGGAAAARNAGFRASTGRYINFLDGDDYLSPEKLARQAAALDADGSCAWCFCDVCEVDAAGNPVGDYSVRPVLQRFSGDLLPVLLAGGFAPPHVFMVRREVLETVGLFREAPELTGCDDYDLWLRIAAAGYRARYLDFTGAFHRLHGANMSMDSGLMDASRAEALRYVTTLFPEAVGGALAAAQDIARDLFARAARASELERRLEELRAGDESCALRERVAQLEAQAARQWEREQRLRAELDRTWARTRVLNQQIRSLTLSGRLRRSLHGVLDAVQALTPEAARAAVRPAYLKFYRRLFPQGKREFDAGEPAGLPAAPQQARMGMPKLLRHPLVSVVLPVWNHARFLAESVASVLDQWYPNLELIVVDDGSTEDLRGVLARFGDSRLQYVRKEHSGIARTLNEGFRRARGEFLTWTSADNAMYPHMLATLLDFLLRRPEIDMTYGDMELMDGNGAPLRDSEYRVAGQVPGAPHKLRLPRSTEGLGRVNDNFIGACFLYRRRIAQIVGEYDHSLLGTEDYDYWLRMNELGSIVHVDSDECLYRYRVHADTLSGRRASEIRGNAELLIELHRERAARYAQPFAVFILTGGGSGAMAPENALELASSFRALGHATAIAGPAAAPPEAAGLASIICDPDDVGELARLFADRAGDSKAIVLNLSGNGGVLAGLARAWDPAPVLYCDWLGEGTDAVSRLEPFPAEKPLWLLCGSAGIPPRLPERFARNWSLFIPAGIGLPSLIALAREARGGRRVPDGFPETGAPVVMFLGPVSETALDFEAAAAAMRRHRDKLFVFVDTGDGSVNPRNYCSGAGNVYWAGARPPSEWPLYLSRAALLMAPFRSGAGLARAIKETLSVYLASGRPVLATRGIADAGFEDAPNLLMCSREEFGACLDEAMRIAADPAAADAYLRYGSAEGAARTVTAAANSRLCGASGPRGASRPRHTESAGPVVLIETRTLDRGGLERMVADMSLALRSRGVRVVIAVTERDGCIGQECRAAGLPVYSPVPDRQAFAQILNVEAPDLVVSHYSTLGAPVAAARKIPVVDMIHAAYIWADRERDEAIRANSVHVTKYIAVSEWARGYSIWKYGIDGERIVSIPNGINAARLLEAARRPPRITRASLGLDEDAYVFLQVATLFGTKAQVHTVSAMARIARRFPRARLLLVGPEEDRPYTECVKRHIRKLRLSDRVLMCGATDAIVDYYRLADAFVLPSITEGWSLAMNEAMLFGLPMIMTAVGGAPEVIENDDIGLLIPWACGDVYGMSAHDLWRVCTNPEPPNLEALQAAMERFCSEPDVWRERGRLGREKVMRNYTTEKATARLLDEICALLPKQEEAAGAGARPE